MSKTGRRTIDIQFRQKIGESTCAIAHVKKGAKKCRNKKFGREDPENKRENNRKNPGAKYLKKVFYSPCKKSAGKLLKQYFGRENSKDTRAIPCDKNM